MPEAKYILFGLALLLGVPFGVALCLWVPRFRHVVLAVMVWSTCVPDPTGINFFSRESYRAATRGFEVSLTDVAALVLLLQMLIHRRQHRMRWLPPLTLLHALYVTVALVSWALAARSLPVPIEAQTNIPYPVFETALYPLFEISKVVRGWFLFFVCVNAIRGEEDIRSLLAGLAMAVLSIAAIAVNARYLQGIHRVAATLGHPNSLATYAAMLGTVAFACMLHFRALPASAAWGALAGLAGLCVVLTISRGGLAALAFGFWIDTVILLPRFFTTKNLVLLGLAALLGAAGIAAAADTLAARFFAEQDGAEDLAYRGLYDREGQLMAGEHPFGVGLGNFSAWSWHRYAAAVDPRLDPGAPAHNIWSLTAGELGYPGVLVLALIWLRFYALAVPRLFARDRSLAGTAAVALTAATLVCQLQSTLQLGYRQTPIYFLLALCMGGTVAVVRADRDHR